MKAIAANPLITTTGGYWLRASSTPGAFLASTGARNPKFPVTAIGRIESGKAEQDQQPRQRVGDMRSDQPALTRDDGRGRLMAGVQQCCGRHQDTASHHGHTAPPE